MKDSDSSRTVPLTVDAVRLLDGSPMVRCTYLVVESDEPSPDWSFMLERERIPFLLESLAGVLYRPSEEEPRFDSAELIEGLYERIEDALGLDIELGDVWIPLEMFPGLKGREAEGPPAGDVVRVGLELFRTAVAFRSDRISHEAFLEAAGEQVATVERSPREAEAFRDWGKMQIDRAIEIYPKEPSQELGWRANEGEAER